MKKEEFASNFLPRKEFLPGKQTSVTPLIVEFSRNFEFLEGEALFIKVHDWIYSYLTVLPYSDEAKVQADESSRRWKLTADEVLRIRTVYEGKECSDVVMVFNSMMKSLGYEASLAKVFKLGADGEPIGHSISIIKDAKNNITYAINSGSKAKFWAIQGNWDFDSGPIKINNWYIWKVAEDQWSMGLVDASQEEETIYSDARQFFKLHQDLN